MICGAEGNEGAPVSISAKGCRDRANLGYGDFEWCFERETLHCVNRGFKREPGGGISYYVLEKKFARNLVYKRKEDLNDVARSFPLDWGRYKSIKVVGGAGRRERTRSGENGDHNYGV